MVKIGIINGPNLNQLGKRKKEYYGTMSLEEINEKLKRFALTRDMQLDFMQSNHEGEIVDTIQSFSKKLDGIIINPGALTYYSYAIRDALEDCPLPIIEVHLSNIFSREAFRAKSITVPACVGQIVGLGYQGYLCALEGISYLLNKNSDSKQQKDNK